LIMLRSLQKWRSGRGGCRFESSAALRQTRERCAPLREDRSGRRVLSRPDERTWRAKNDRASGECACRHTTSACHRHARRGDAHRHERTNPGPSRDATGPQGGGTVARATGVVKVAAIAIAGVSVVRVGGSIRRGEGFAPSGAESVPLEAPARLRMQPPNLLLGARSTTSSRAFRCQWGAALPGDPAGG
jgi:hypothetical protein